VISEPAVGSVKNSWKPGYLSRREERPGPPDLLREIHDGFGAGIDFTFTGYDLHLAQQLFSRQCEKGSNAGILQRSRAEAALLECAAESPRQGSTNVAIAVDEDPASRDVPALSPPAGSTSPTRHSPAKAARRVGSQPAYAGRRVEPAPMGNAEIDAIEFRVAMLILKERSFKVLTCSGRGVVDYLTGVSVERR